MSLKETDLDQDKQFKKALKYAFLLLKYRGRSRGELVHRLGERGFSNSITHRVTEYLQKHNYLNDQDFVESFLRASLEKGWGPKKIEFALRRWGISGELIEKALEDKSIYKDKIKELIEKQFSRYKGKKDSYQKVIRYMVNRGFEYDMIVEHI